MSVSMRDLSIASPPASGGGGVKSALRVLAIFEFFAATAKPATLTELSEQLGLPKSSCFALMETLRREGYVYSLGKRHGYFPTSRLRSIGEGILVADPILMLARPHLLALSEKTAETVMFGKLDGNDALYLEVIESAHAVRFAAHVGQRKMLHNSASGRALIGLMPSEQRKKYISTLKRPRISPKTIVNVEDLNMAIEQGNATGWHVAIGENRPEITSIAAALRFDNEGYFFCVAGPMQRLSGQESGMGTLVAREVDEAKKKISWK